MLIGKTAPFLLVSVAQGVLLFASGKLLFGMSWGTMPWLLPVVITCTSLAATALGLVTATLVQSDAQVSAYANTVVIVLGGISGCFMPLIRSFGDTSRRATYWTGRRRWTTRSKANP